MKMSSEIADDLSGSHDDEDLDDVVFIDNSSKPSFNIEHILSKVSEIF